MTENLIISDKKKLKDAIKLIDSVHRNCLIVLDSKKKIVGTITDGDIRRALLKKKNIDTSLKDLCNKKYVHFDTNYNLNNIKDILLNKKNNINIIPIINKNKKLIKIFTKASFQKKKIKISKIKNIKIVIMAGGIGKRLKPATNVLPKPLIPIGKDTLIEKVMNNFIIQGMNDFVISINYKKELIKAYFKDIRKKFKLSFIEENKPLGTAGSLYLLKRNKCNNFFVTNCDNIINVNLRSIINFHFQKNNDFTLVGNNKKINIPYGQIQRNQSGNFKDIKEKPNLKILINSGLYLINKKVIRLIKQNRKLDMNDLIKICSKKNLKIGIYTIKNNSWIDVGQWNEYKKFSNKIKH